MSKAIVSLDKKRQLYLPGFTLTPTGMKADRGVTQEDWEDAGDLLGEINKRCLWYIGDWYRIGAERKWGETYDDCEERFGIASGSARDSAWVARTFELSDRSDKLSWSHHRVVASLPKSQRMRLLEKAETEGLSKSDLQKLVKALLPDVIVEMDEEDEKHGRFRVIYADPPWEYSDERGKRVDGGSAAAQYDTLSIDRLCAMNVSELSARNAVLFMWVTVPLLAEAMPVIEAWGFQYKTHIVWDKTRPLYGHYSHVQHELLCICTKGSCTPKKGVDLPKSVIAINRTKHSAKPVEFYELIEKLYPTGKKIELFAREERKGWKAWGNEAPGHSKSNSKSA